MMEKEKQNYHSKIVVVMIVLIYVDYQHVSSL